MKKVGIITIIDNNNYGNRLQNYAVQEKLKKYNLEVVTIKNTVNTNKENSIIEEKLRKIKNILNKDKVKKKYSKQRYKNFEEFTNNYIKTTKKTITYNNSKKEAKKYDFFVVGSDQVWNPNFGRLTHIDLLKFSPKNKNIAIAASFGVSNLTKEQKENCKGAFENFKMISTREDAGKEMVAELSGREDVEVLVDPTMMLDVEEWEKIIKKPEQIKFNKYILNYFLAGMSEETEKQIKKFAKENNCKIINILDKEDIFNTCDPSEFLYLVKNAFLVCTDSFHSSVFSILFHRPFVVFERADVNRVVAMNSRLETLLNKLELQKQFFNGNISEEQLNIDYKRTDIILNEERNKASKFIEKALDIK